MGDRANTDPKTSRNAYLAEGDRLNRSVVSEHRDHGLYASRGLSRRSSYVCSSLMESLCSFGRAVVDGEIVPGGEKRFGHPTAHGS